MSRILPVPVITQKAIRNITRSEKTLMPITSSQKNSAKTSRALKNRQAAMREVLIIWSLKKYRIPKSIMHLRMRMTKDRNLFFRNMTMRVADTDIMRMSTRL